jgi:hypothetical protein
MFLPLIGGMVVDVFAVDWCYGAIGGPQSEVDDVPLSSNLSLADDFFGLIGGVK